MLLESLTRSTDIHELDLSLGISRTAVQSTKTNNYYGQPAMSASTTQAGDPQGKTLHIALP